MYYTRMWKEIIQMATDNKNGILGKLGDLFGGEKDGAKEGAGDLLGNIGDLLGGDGAKNILSKLDGLKSLDMSQIQSVLSALGQSGDHQVQSAKQDLEQSKHDGTEFLTKLKGYITSVSQFLPAILPALQKILGGNK